MANYRWKLNGVMLPRNPDEFEWPLTKGNIYYETMLDGSQRRMTVPRKFMGRDVKLRWAKSDARTRAALAAAIVSNAINVLTIDGTQPAVQLNMYFDDLTKATMSSDIFDGRLGQGGTRQDLEISGRAEPYFRSVMLIPTGVPNAAIVNAAAAGPLGDSVMDYLPKWNGVPWSNALAAGANTFTLSNLGNAPWSPVIRITGPINPGFTINVTYYDVDGSGQGVTFTWLGSALAINQSILFDTDSGRVYTLIGGVKTESYSFSIAAQSTASPIPFWPAIPSGNFSAYCNNVAGQGVTTTLDYSNNGTEQFRYM